LILEVGSTILVSGYKFDDEEASIDETITEIRSKIDFKPRRLQYGNSQSSFVIEFNEKLTDQSIYPYFFHIKYRYNT
jgi:hypothetical protein